MTQPGLSAASSNMSQSIAAADRFTDLPLVATHTARAWRRMAAHYPQALSFPLQNIAPFDLATSQIQMAWQAELLVFTSPSAVEIFSNLSVQENVTPGTPTFAAMGKSSAELLHQCFVHQTEILFPRPPQENSQGLLSLLREVGVQGLRVVLLLGLGANGQPSQAAQALADGLQQAGVASVMTVPLYQRSDRALTEAAEKQEFLQLLQTPKRWWFASSHCVDVFCHLLRQVQCADLSGHVAIANHQAILHKAKLAGFDGAYLRSLDLIADQ